MDRFNPEPPQYSDSNSLSKTFATPGTTRSGDAGLILLNQHLSHDDPPLSSRFPSFGTPTDLKPPETPTSMAS